MTQEMRRTKGKWSGAAGQLEEEDETETQSKKRLPVYINLSHVGPYPNGEINPFSSECVVQNLLHSFFF